MMFEFTCPKCGFHKNNLDAKFAGKKVKCPKCQAAADVQRSNRTATPSDAAPQPDNPPPPQANHTAPQPNSGIPIFRDEAGNRLCRRCRGIIHEDAKVCQHCRMWQDPSQYGKAFGQTFGVLSAIVFGIPILIGAGVLIVCLILVGAFLYGVSGAGNRADDRKVSSVNEPLENDVKEPLKKDEDISHLTAQIAESEIENQSWRRIDLNKFRTMDDAAAEILGKKGTNLELNGLTSLTDAQAQSLAKSGSRLQLNGLASLSDAQAECLSKHNGDIFLNGLTSLSDAAAESLAKLPSHGLSSNWLKLDGLTSITTAQAESFSKYRGSLWLQGLSSLSDEAAKSLVKAPLLRLHVDYDKLPPSAAEILRGPRQ